ncbi:MAG: YihY/virulence factor BrkB family protein [Rhodospirillales bacterium]
MSDGDNYAAEPRELTRSDWWAILRRTWDQIGEDHLSLVAAGVAFYALLALFPLLAVTVALYGVFADPAGVEAHLALLDEVAPAEVTTMVGDQVKQLTAVKESNLSFTAVIGLLIAFWSSKAGVSAMMTGLNIAYEEKDSRSFIKHLLVALALTGVLLLVTLVAFGALVLVPLVLSFFSSDGPVAWIAGLLRWPLALGFVFVGIGLLYRFGPARRPASLSWFSWGAVMATLVWLLASVLFSLYVANFASYNETYGSLGAIVILLMWFYVSAFVVLLGAELNSEMELQTARDTTVGPPRPMGQRGAFVADNVVTRESEERSPRRR